jgi:hypothetical protein
MTELLDFVRRNTTFDENHIASRTLKAMRFSAELLPGAEDAWLREALGESDDTDAQAAQLIADLDSAETALQ